MNAGHKVILLVRRVSGFEKTYLLQEVYPHTDLHCLQVASDPLAQLHTQTVSAANKGYLLPVLNLATILHTFENSGVRICNSQPRMKQDPLKQPYLLHNVAASKVCQAHHLNPLLSQILHTILVTYVHEEWIQTGMVAEKSCGDD